MTIQQVNAVIDKEWNSNSMTQLTILLERVLDLRKNEANEKKANNNSIGR